MKYYLLNETYAAHNALDDVKTLQKLTQLVKHRLKDYSFQACHVVNTANMATVKKTLQPLLAAKIITDSMGTKIARARLHYRHLKFAFDRNGFDGLSSVLGEKVNRVVRVTKHGPTIQRIVEHFSEQ